MTQSADATQDPLQDLVIDAQQMDREQLAGLLQGRVGLDPDRNKMVFLNDVRSRSTQADLALLALLAQRALNLLEPELPEGLTPKELSEATGIPGGSLRPNLKRLADSGLILKRDKSYVVPPPVLPRIETELGDANE